MQSTRTPFPSLRGLHYSCSPNVICGHPLYKCGPYSLQSITHPGALSQYITPTFGPLSLLWRFKATLGYLPDPQREHCLRKAYLEKYYCEDPAVRTPVGRGWQGPRVMKAKLFQKLWETSGCMGGYKGITLGLLWAK